MLTSIPSVLYLEAMLLLREAPDAQPTPRDILRYCRATGDRFFILFALSFWVEACNRTHMAIFGPWDEDDAVTNTIRLIAYGLILLAILDKNRPRSK